MKNVFVVKDAAVVTVTKAGYFKGIKTFIGETDKSAFFRIKLLPKTNSGTIDAASGGNVTLSNGLIIALPSAAVITVSSGAAYTGIVNVAAHFIDPTSDEIAMIMPGDLRGINADGSLKRLTSYGMAAVELTGTSGELLQIASGKKATLTMPVPSGITGTAPASIPLWYFDEAKGLWKEEGQAVKTGNSYVGEVSHFSFWNCDVPANYVQFNCTLHDEAGDPIPYAYVKISVVGSPYNAAWGVTDSSGYVSGAVPDNAQLLLEIFTSFYCGNSVLSQTFTTASSNVSLGVITVVSGVGGATVSGTVTDCMNMPVTNGYIVMINGWQYSRYALSNTGTYEFTTLLCNNTATVSLVGEDLNTNQQSSPVTQILNTGANVVGNIQACGLSIEQFISYSINGTAAASLIWPTDSIMHGGNGTINVSYISGASAPGNPSNSTINFSFDNTGIAVGSTQPMQSFYVSQIGTQTTTSSGTVNITEYGAVGEFIAGDFTATVIDNMPPTTTYTISGSFRVRRNF